MRKRGHGNGLIDSLALIAARRCHHGNSHRTYSAPDYGPEQDTVRGAPRIPTANRARCTVARPHRSDRATAGSASTATGCHGSRVRPTQHPTASVDTQIRPLVDT